MSTSTTENLNGNGSGRHSQSTDANGIPAVNVKPVDFRTIEGSYPGDHRAQPGDVADASEEKAADNGGPRKPMEQAG